LSLPAQASSSFSIEKKDTGRDKPCPYTNHLRLFNRKTLSLADMMNLCHGACAL
jgi:hypothetical protein